MRKLDNQVFVDRSNKIHNNKYDYCKTKYAGTYTNIIIKCPYHGYFEQTPKNHMKGKGCFACNYSTGEREVAKALTKLSLKFVPQYKIPGTCYRYDFYVPKLKLLIEYDGVQHYKPVAFFGGNKAFYKRKDLDSIKTNLALSNNLYLIRVPYYIYETIYGYLLHKISSIYKYRVGGIWYKNFISLCRGENLPKETLVKDIIMYKSSNNGRST